MNEFRSGKDEVEHDAGESGVPHNLGSFPIRIIVITTHNEKLYNILKPDILSKILLYYVRNCFLWGFSFLKTFSFKISHVSLNSYMICKSDGINTLLTHLLYCTWSPQSQASPKLAQTRWKRQWLYQINSQQLNFPHSQQKRWKETNFYHRKTRDCLYKESLMTFGERVKLKGKTL